MAKKKKSDAPADPDKLVRQSAGRYLSGDQRFEVREADVGWFLVDTTQSNEFGQELIQGPFGTLKAVREAIPAARETKAEPMRPRPAAKERPNAKAKAKKAPPPPPSWIERLPKAEATRVRKLMAALEAEGIDDVEELVRRDHDGLLPAVATALIERRLNALVQSLPADERARGRELVRGAARILSDDGGRVAEPLPGWSLIEREPPNRRIDLSG